MEEENIYSIILRHDTSTQWMVNDPILALSEYGVEDDTHRVKRGNGESKWSELLYEDFGLSYLFTFDNIKGDAKENQNLKAALDERVSKDTFKDVGGGVLTGLNITNENGFICTITKRTTDVESSATSLTNMYIVSNDHSIQGYWTVDELGAQILDLRGNTTIEDYTPGHMYYSDQMCFHNNKLYRAIANFTAEETFNPNQWVILTSLLANDIKYDNKMSGLESKTVKEAIDELQDLDNEKLPKTKRANKVYGTNESGEQYLYDLEELRKVDTVNGVKADNNRNVQIDATMINVNDGVTAKQTIKQALDARVNKDVAGVGERIVKDFSLTYNDEDGSINVLKSKLSLEDGTVEEQTQKINVASNTELDNVKTELVGAIDIAKRDLQANINTTKQELQTNIENLDAELTSEIASKSQELQTNIDNVDTTLSAKIDTAKDELDQKIDSNVAVLDSTITLNKQELNNKIDSEVNKLTSTINQNKAEGEQALTQGLAAKIDKTLADSLITDISVSTEGSEPTLKITSKNTDTKTEFSKHLHFTKKGNIDLKTENDHIVVDTTKIDTAIADNFSHLGVVDTRLASHDSQLRTVNNDLDIHSEHLATIDAELAEVDKNLSEHQLHLEQIDTSIKNQGTKHNNDVTDLKATDAKQATQILDIETQLDVIGEQLQAQSDTIVSVTDEVRANEANIATNAANIAKNTQDIETNATEIANNNRNIGKNADEITENRMAIDENLQAIIRNDIAIQANLQAIQANDTDIANLQAEKADKTFASATDNKVVGSLKLATIANNEILVLDNKSVNPTDGTSSESKIKVISSDNTVVAKTVLDDAGNVTAIDLATNLDVDVHYFYTSATLNKTIPSENTISFDSLTNTTAPTDIQVKDIVSDADGTWARVQEVDSTNKTIKCVTFHNQTRAVWGSIDGTLADQQDLKAALDDKLDKTGLSQVATNAKLEPIGSGYGSIQGLAFHLNYYDTVNKKANSFTKQLEILATNSVEFFRKTATNPNIVQFNVLSEGVAFDAKESGLTSTLLAPAVRELKGLVDNRLLITEFNTFKSEYETYKTSVTKSLGDLETTIDGKLADLETSVTENITPKIAEIEKSIDASSETIIEINEQIATKVDKATAANIVYGTDASGNQTTYDKTAFGKVDTVNGLTADSNKNILIKSENIPYTETQVAGLTSGATDVKGAIDNARTDLFKLYSMLQATQLVWSLDTMYETQNFDMPIKPMDFFTAASSNGVVLMAQISNIDNMPNPAEFTSGLDLIRAGVESDALELVGIPEQLEAVSINMMMNTNLLENYLAMDSNPHCVVADADGNTIADFHLGVNGKSVMYNSYEYTAWCPELLRGAPESYLVDGVELHVTLSKSDGTEEAITSLQCKYIGDNAPEEFKNYMIIDRMPA